MVRGIRRIAARKRDHHSGLAIDGGHYLVHGAKQADGFVFFDQRRIRDLHIVNSLPLILARNPEQTVLKNAVLRVIGVCPIFQHLNQRAFDVAVRDARDGSKRELLFGFRTLAEDVSVEVDLLQICEHSLPVLQNTERCADANNVFLRVLWVVQNQIGKVDVGVIVDFSRKIFAGQGGCLELARDRFTLLSDCRFLFIGQNKPQLPHVVKRIADLMGDSEGDEDVGSEVAVHMGVQIGAEFVFSPNIGLEDGFLLGQMIVFRLAHERLGDGRHGCFLLDASIRPDICDLGIAQTENPESAVLAVDVGGDFALYGLHSVGIEGKRQTADRRKVPDEVAGVMIGRLQIVKETIVPVPVKIDNHILFVVEKKASEVIHKPSCPMVRKQPCMLLARSGCKAVCGLFLFVIQKSPQAQF
jgi:hypothetical protein